MEKLLEVDKWIKYYFNNFSITTIWLLLKLNKIEVFKYAENYNYCGGQCILAQTL